MPTGFTANVVDGKITTLREFALLCARGMGACILMRDEPLGAPIPDRFEPRIEYHEKQITKARSILAEIEGLTLAECAARAEQDFADRSAAYTAHEADRDTENNRLRAMLKLVEGWHTEAEGLKEFMTEQLRISMSDFRSFPPQRMTASEWLASTKHEALRSLSYSEKAILEEINQTALRNQWLDALRRSLPPIPADTTHAALEG